MKKHFYIIYILTVLILFPNISYSYTGTTYSSEQFRIDMKSYLDEQQFREKSQDIINNMNAGYDNAQRQFEMNIMQRQLEDSKKDMVETDRQINEVKELINQQNQIISEQKKLKDQKEVYTNTKAFCESLKLKYTEGVNRDLSDNCMKYDVYIKTQVVPRPSLLDDPIEENVKILPKTKVKSVKDVSASSTETYTTSSQVSNTNIINIPKQSLYAKTIQKIRSLFGWIK